MKPIPQPIFKEKIQKIIWKKIYAREYGVQYSEMAILCLSPKAAYHIPRPSVDQVIIPDENNTSFHIDQNAWNGLLDSLNQKYTTHLVKLEEYEKQFLENGEKYVKLAKEIAQLNIASLSNEDLKKYYLSYQDKLFKYSVFAWTSFILNIYVADRATGIIDTYITKNNVQDIRQEIINSLFQPVKKAAILELQTEVESFSGEVTNEVIDTLYITYKWLSCLDLHNKPWTKVEFSQVIKEFKKQNKNDQKLFSAYAKELNITDTDLAYLLIAKRFVYIKDARDDFRRQGVYYVLPFFAEIARRMKISAYDISYLQEKDITNFLGNNIPVYLPIIKERRKGFVMYLDGTNDLVCLSSQGQIDKVLTEFRLLDDTKAIKKLTGRPACSGKAIGKVVIIKGIKDLPKMQKGNILVAVTTHPDYTMAMRKAAAIVTDEGGITSHAAIVAREYNIPCIVGTHQATKVLTDGDMIEVDAENGIIIKISNEH